MKYGTKRSLHGMTKTRFYQIWKGMLKRCYKENCISYKYYGAKGIQVCDEWKEFINFKRDMYYDYLDHCEKHGESNTSIERLDINKDYCLSNCTWATWAEQNMNKGKRGKNQKQRQIVSRRSYIGVSPNGDTYHFNNQKQFALEHGLIPAGVGSCLLGKRKHHKNWTFKEIFKE